MDREKVIKGLECHQIDKDHRINCSDCPYHCDEFMNGLNDLHNDALELLKEQEAVEPYQRDAVWLCGNCEKEVVGWDDDIDGKEYRYPFCRQCGRSVKWE